MAARFEESLAVDGRSFEESLAVARRSQVGHFIYLSVVHQPPECRATSKVVDAARGSQSYPDSPFQSSGLGTS